jgi:hypothetical protein
VIADGGVVLPEVVSSAEETATHEPTFTSASLALTSFVKVVLPVHVTAT